MEAAANCNAPFITIVQQPWLHAPAIRHGCSVATFKARCATVLKVFHLCPGLRHNPYAFAWWLYDNQQAGAAPQRVGQPSARQGAGWVSMRSIQMKRQRLPIGHPDAVLISVLSDLTKRADYGALAAYGACLPPYEQVTR
jgi:hypothetical protein